MWPFTRKPTDREQDRELRDEVRELRSEVERMGVEWEEWYGKYRRLYAQISRRAKLEEEREQKLGDPAAAVAGRSPLPRTGNPLALALLQPPKPG